MSESNGQKSKGKKGKTSLDPSISNGTTPSIP
jgi:hypothetical protein